MMKTFSLITVATIMLVLVSCQEATAPQQIGTAPTDCFWPGDAIFKFKNLDADAMLDAAFVFFKKHKLDLSDADSVQIKTWVNETVFGPNQGGNVVEWNMDDPDFCQLRKNELRNGADSVLAITTIKVCNSVMNRDVSTGPTWWTKLGNSTTTLELIFCSKLLKTFDFVPYYEILNNQGKLEYSIQTDNLKHLAKTDVYIRYKNSVVEITEKALTTESFLYSGMLNLDPSDYLKE